MARALLDLVDLPEAKRLQLTASPLVLALCQVQFATTLSVADAGALVPFQRAVQDQYPVVTPASQVQMQFQFGGGETDIRQSGISQAWTFADPEDNWAVVLSTNSISIETRVYSHFEDFLNRLQRILDALTQHVAPAFGTRVGLRYINEIPEGDLSWRDVISPQVLGPLATPFFSGRATQAVQELILNFPKQQGINFRYGLFPQGTTIRPRSIAEQKDRSYSAPFYLLDFDVFRSFQPSDPLRMEATLIIDHVQDYHDVICRIFRWSITERYLEMLAGGSHGGA